MTTSPATSGRPPKRFDLLLLEQLERLEREIRRCCSRPDSLAWVKRERALIHARLYPGEPK